MQHYTVTLPQNANALADFVAACDEAFENRMDAVAQEVANVKELKFLGLTGPSCAGKTTAAKKFTACLEQHGHRVHVISVDDFYYDKQFLQKRADSDPDIEIDYDSEDTIDLELFAQKIESLLLGNPTEMPRFDFPSGLRVTGETIVPQADDVFLFEGIQVLYPRINAILRGKAYRSIYICPMSAIQMGREIFSPNEIRLMRRLVRDFRYRASEPDFTLYLWQSVRENEEKNIFPNAHTCDAFIDSTMPYEIGMLKPYLDGMLSHIPRENRFFDDAQQILARIADVFPVSASYMTQNSLYKEFI